MRTDDIVFCKSQYRVQIQNYVTKEEYGREHLVATQHHTKSVHVLQNAQYCFIYLSKYGIDAKDKSFFN